VIGGQPPAPGSAGAPGDVSVIQDPMLARKTSPLGGRPDAEDQSVRVDPFLTRIRGSTPPPPTSPRQNLDPEDADNLVRDPFLTNNPFKDPAKENLNLDPFMTHTGDQADDDYDLENDPFMTHSQTPVAKVPVPPPEAPRPEPPPSPEEYVIPYWYQSENNWFQNIEAMEAEYRNISARFTGEWSSEERVTQNSSGENQELRSVEVVDVFQDEDFPGDDRSWYRSSEHSEMKAPSHWKRLYEISQSYPYPVPDANAGGLNPRPGRVYQGGLEDFYLVEALQTIGMKPNLVRDVFANMEFSNPQLGLFMIRLYKHAQWMYVPIDGTLPFDKNWEMLCCTSEFQPDCNWPGLIEKAYAKLHGSWEAVSGGGHVEDVLCDLTGGCASRFKTRDVAGDRLWQYLYEMMRFCVFGCTIDERECACRMIPIDSNWASSVYDVKKWQGVPYVCVCCAAPMNTVRHFPVCDVPSEHGYGLSEGFLWLRVDDFQALFDIVYECRLTNTYMGNPTPGPRGQPFTPGWMSGSPWFEELWAYQGTVYAESAPSFLIEVKNCPVVITLEASQTDVRYSNASEVPEYGRHVQVPLLCRFFQCSMEVDEHHGGEIYMVHMSAWGHCRDAMTTVKVMKPGKYLAMTSMPMAYQCNRMIFRTYSSLPINVRPVVEHHAFVSVAPASPLNAIPYTLVGFARITDWDERLPSPFDENEGKGRKGRSWKGKMKHLGGSESSVEQFEASRQGYKVVGEFGGRGALATVEASEVQAVGCPTQ